MGWTFRELASLQLESRAVCGRNLTDAHRIGKRLVYLACLGEIERWAKRGLHRFEELWHPRYPHRLASRAAHAMGSNRGVGPRYGRPLYDQPVFGCQCRQLGELRRYRVRSGPSRTVHPWRRYLQLEEI